MHSGVQGGVQNLGVNEVSIVESYIVFMVMSVDEFTVV